jgi:probable phosphoglycerate mutase
MKIYLIRHGQTTGDVEDRYGGDYEDHLTEGGREQARALAEKLRHSGIEIIFCSPKVRARETAEIVADAIGCRVEVVKDIRERNNYGALTGMVKQEAREKHPEHVEALKDRRHAVPGSEGYEPFGERVTNALDAITREPYRTVAILSHGGPISYIFREILKLGETKIDDCGFVELEKNGEQFSVVRMDGITLKDPQ